MHLEMRCEEVRARPGANTVAGRRCRPAFIRPRASRYRRRLTRVARRLLHKGRADRSGGAVLVVALVSSGG